MRIKTNVSKALIIAATLPVVLLTGCVTGQDSSANSETEVPELLGEDNVPVQKTPSLKEGPLEDIDLKEIAYQGIEKQLSAYDTEKVRVEIGDFESFKFTIVHMSRAGEDITNIATEQPDRLTVATSGWYKRAERTAADGSIGEKCFSFETTVHLSSEGEMWIYDDREPLKFSRENTEDCF